MNILILNIDRVHVSDDQLYQLCQKKQRVKV